jgi:hypothetical protein
MPPYAYSNQFFTISEHIGSEKSGKESPMKNLWIWRLIGALILLIAFVAVGFLAYHAGLAQGQTALAPHNGAPVLWRREAAGGLLSGLILVPFLLLGGLFFLSVFVFLPLRMIFGPYRMHLRGRWHTGEKGVPPAFEEWHRRAHEAKKTEE